MKNISKGNIKNLKKSFTDKTGYFSRFIKLKNLEIYANEIDTVLTKYNKKSCDETMMVKGLRKSFSETTNRKIHQEDLEKIVKQIAKKIGLNGEIVGIMGKHHDIGHTFLGHSGEWWISNIYEDDGLGSLCHNAIGARDLIFTKNVYDEIINKIKTHNPNISEKELKKIRDSLYLIIDGINSHNGEKPEKEYIPNLSKTKEEFEKEILRCYTEQGYDRKIVPATSEACLMRLADQISYIPLDMVDGLREGLVRDKDGKVVSTLDQDYIDILGQLGISEDEIQKVNETQNFNSVTEKLKEIFIEDVIKHSSKCKITMSKEKMVLMNKLRDLNNTKAVNNVNLAEDQETYPKAIRELIDKYSQIYLKLQIAQEKDGNYSEQDKKFIRFASDLNSEDLKFTSDTVKLALISSTKQELQIARDCVQKGIPYHEKSELGLGYSHKNERIKSYIAYYTGLLEQGKLVNYSKKEEQEDILKILNGVKSKKSKNYLPMEERMAKAIAGQYVSSLSDHEFIDLLLAEKIITSDKKRSLKRKYLDIEDLESEVYRQSDWVNVSNAQKQATESFELKM